MVSAWDLYASRMDAAIDKTLGDDISYALAPDAAFVTIKGFVHIAGGGQLNIEQLDVQLDTRPRVKINKELMPTMPASSHRLTHPKLGAGTWQPIEGDDDVETDGRYWIFDVQKVSDA